MAVAEFPLPSVGSSNPFPNIWYQIQPEVFQVGFTEYDDSGRDFKLQNGGNGIKRWSLIYIGKSAAQVAILDSHAYSAKIGPDGLSAFSFNYRDRDGTLYSGVRYSKYERPQHVGLHNQRREVELVKFP